MTVGAMKEMIAHVEEQKKYPFHKKMSTLDGAFRYARLAMDTYCTAKVTIEPIDEGFWKYLITVDSAEPVKEEEHPPWWGNETIDPVEQAQIELQCAVDHEDMQGIAEATVNLATAKMAKMSKMLVTEKKPYKGDIDETH